MSDLFDMDRRTPIISMWQPWAQWVELGWKTIESRRHKRFASLAGQRIGIHRAQHWDDGWIEDARRYLTDEQFEQTMEMPTLGSIVRCTVLVTVHRPLTIKDEPAALIECSSLRYALVLVDREIFEPIWMNGRQLIWRADLNGRAA